jgi:type I restriction enzyme S subunit
MTAQQLKNSILQMAVQGKLVPQDPNDEPASVLLEKIKAEKAQLIADGKIKKPKKTSEIFRGATRNLPYTFCEQTGKEIKDISDEIPFEIPESWEWVRLGNICEIARGGSPRPIKQFLTEQPDGINWIKISDSDKGGKYINSTKEKIKPEGMNKSRFVHAGDFLLTNSMSFGRPYILNVDGCIHDGWLVLSGYNLAYDKDYLYYMLSSAFAYYQFCDVVSGAVVKNLNSDKVADALFPLPPLSEQHRIVAKIEELLPYIEQYNKAETQLTTLNTTFPEMLKKSILQEAVQGKLVPQDPNDEPASVLLERIRAEKQELIRQGKIKKDKHESVIFTRDKIPYEKRDGVEKCIADEVPFELPDNWAWVRLGSISTVLGGKRIPAGRKLTTENTGHIYIRVSDMKEDTVSMDNLLYVPEDIYTTISKYIINKEDIYITVAGTIGRIGKIPNELDGANLTENADRLVFNNINQDWLIKCLKSNLIQSQIADATTKVGQPKLAILRIQELLCPLPPLAEQHRIVEKINELMPIINTISK